MNQQLYKFSPLLASVMSLVVYLLTMSRGVMPIDAGELAASQYTLGISHPSGYPLFNIIGFLWSKLPIGSVIFRLNLLCAIWVAIANFFLIKTALLILNHSFKQTNSPKKNNQKITEKKSDENSHHPLHLIASIAGVLMIGFCTTWWIQSAGVEVYSLHLALLTAFIFVFIRNYIKPITTAKDWALAGLLLGLCFTNHLTSILILPGILLLYFMKMKFNMASIKMGIIFAVAAFIIFIAFYGFMMSRAGSSPEVNYGNPQNMEYLKRHVSGWQFQSFMGNEKKSNTTMSLFFENFTQQSAIIGVLLFLGGIVFTFMKNPKIAAFWMLNLFATLIYASQYDIHDIENYFLLAYLSASIFICFCIYWIFTLIKGIEKNKVAYLFLLIPVLPLIMNFKDADQSKLNYIDEYSIAALNSVEPNALIVSREWDVLVSPLYYYHLVENQRPDVLILDKELLRRSWYSNQIKAWDGNFAGNLQKQMDEFNEAVLPFERQEKFNPSLIQQKFEAYITAILSEYKNRPVYVSSLVLDADIARGVDVKLPAGTILVPDAYFYRVVPADTSIYYPLAKPLDYQVKFTEAKKENKFERQILNFSMSVLSSRVGYEMNYGKKEEAKKIVEVMQSIDPSVQMPEGL